MEAVRNFKKFHRIFHNKNVLIQGFKAHVAAKRLNLINLHLQHFVYIQKVERLADEESGEGGDVRDGDGLEQVCQFLLG